MYHFIVNPYSKSEKGRRTWERLLNKIKESGVDFKIYMTEYVGHATKLAKEIYQNRCDKDDPIVIVGGDGSINEVLNGIGLSDQPVIGLIPNGSGNDFARGLGYPHDPDAALDIVLKNENTKLLDCGRATVTINGEKHSRRFAVSGGVGYDAGVCEDLLNSNLKKTFNKLKLGELSYFIYGFKEFAAYKKATCEVQFDDEEPMTLNNIGFISAHNLRYEGGGYAFAPEATAEDGEISVCVVGPNTKPKFFFAFILNKTFVGIHRKFKGIFTKNCKHVSIKIDKVLAAHTDGEVIGRVKEIDFEVIPGAFRFIS